MIFSVVAPPAAAVAVADFSVLVVALSAAEVLIERDWNVAEQVEEEIKDEHEC